MYLASAITSILRGSLIADETHPYWSTTSRRGGVDFVARKFVPAWHSFEGVREQLKTRSGAK